MQKADEPLRKVTLNLYESDVQWFQNRYGWGWSEHLRHVMRREVNAMSRLDEELNYGK